MGPCEPSYAQILVRYCSIACIPLNLVVCTLVPEQREQFFSLGHPVVVVAAGLGWSFACMYTILIVSSSFFLRLPLPRRRCVLAVRFCVQRICTEYKVAEEADTAPPTYDKPALRAQQSGFARTLTRNWVTFSSAKAQFLCPSCVFIHA